MLIGGLQKLTLIDYPGKIAATVFLAGCNFRCPWCYNPELVLSSHKRQFKKISERYFFNFLKQREKLIEGVVICGGEPTINEELPDFIGKIKKLGYPVKLDTNGSNPEMLSNLIKNKMIDYVAMDVKATLAKQKTRNKKQEYSRATGIDPDSEKIRKSIEILKNSGIDYEFRTTMVPKLHEPESIIKIAKQLKGAKVYFLQQFKPEKIADSEYSNLKPFSKEQTESIQKECEKYLPTKIRN